MRYFSVLAVIFAVMGAQSYAHAQDDATDADAAASRAKVKAGSEPNAANREDIDKEITNARLRASTGAKSLISLQSAITYNGGSIEAPLARDRKQLSPGETGHDNSKLVGSISAKLRASDHDNINVGFAASWLTPTYKGERGQIDNPYASYSRVFKAAEIQNVFEVVATKYTTDGAVNSEKLNYNLDVDHTFLAHVGHSKLQLGLNLAYARDFYSSVRPDGKDQNQDSLAAYPFMEYEFSDTFSFRTVYRGFSYYNTRTATSTFAHDDPTQSMGIGISVTRDIYLYPNVQWVWADVRGDKTNVALAANINL
jgi:hypothetical protein